MKKVIPFWAVALCAGLLSFCAPTKMYRWDYKLLIDTSGHRVFAMRASATTINELVKIKRPSKDDMHNQRAEEEKQKVTITGYIVEDGAEKDGDYHLVVTNKHGDSLIAEIPSPESAKLHGFPALRTKYTAARKFITDNVEEHPGAIGPCPNGPVKVKITGVVFFDKVAHGNGHSRYGLEIHPVLAIAKAP